MQLIVPITLSALVLVATTVHWSVCNAAPAAATHASGASYPKGAFAVLDALPDWGGTWTYNPHKRDSEDQPTLKGKYLADYQTWEQAVRQNHGVVPDSGSHCAPPGMPRIMMVPQYPIEYLFTPGRVTTLYEAWMQRRVIFTDGRRHPPDLDPTFNGDSIGHWEGDTLVVDTVGINTRVKVSPGVAHSGELHIIERIHLAKGAADTLVDEMTLEDPVAFAKPWSTRLTYTRSRTEDLIEYECEENDRNPVDDAGRTQFK